MFKNALVSVSDKTGLIEFLKPFAEKGLRIVCNRVRNTFLYHFCFHSNLLSF